MFQFFLFGMLVALTTNNLGVLWVSIELATLATVQLVALYRSPAAIASAWKYFVLCGVGIALALFGTVIVFFAAMPALGHGNAALSFSALLAHASELNPTAMAIAFCFLMVGYGTKTGLVPMHAWLPDAHAEGPTPISAILSGLLLNVALYALVHMQMLASGALPFGWAGKMMIAFGLLSLLVAAFALHGQIDIKRMFAFSSIEHMGLATLAFGIGTPLSCFAGLLHMATHSITKSAVFFAVGHAAQAMRTQKIAQMNGLLRHRPALGWGLMLAAAGIAGFPPFGLFTSELLLVLSAIAAKPWLVPLLLLGLLVAMAAVFRHVQAVLFGQPPEHAKAIRMSLAPLWWHLAISLMLGIALPQWISHWFQSAAALIAHQPGEWS